MSDDRQADSADPDVTDPAAAADPAAPDPAAVDPVNPAGDQDADQAADDRRDRRPKITEQRIRLNSTAVALLRQACPSATLGGSIELAAERLRHLEGEAATRETLADYLAAHAQAQAMASAEHVALLASITKTLTAGLESQEKLAAELKKVCQSIAGSVELLIQPQLDGDGNLNSMHEVMNALTGIATAIEGVADAVSGVSQQIAAMGN